jgi:hypothetical protein
MWNEDPLWRLRHALLGVTLALAISVPVAAALATWFADLWADRYALRVSLYALLLAYVIVGSIVLFARVARYETQPLTLRRLGRWVLSLWLWPALWWLSRSRPMSNGVHPRQSTDNPPPGQGGDQQHHP